MSAPELSAEERATVERFEAAPDPDESRRMQVANAVAGTFRKSIANGYVSPTECVDAADAAIAVMRGER
jgi:hypothetical protein